MAEGGDMDILMGGTAKEGSEMTQEQFREQMAQTQAALQQLWKEEGAARGQDRSLAGIIVQFLGQPANTDLFLLISRVVSQDIPSELILAILSLVDDNAGLQVNLFLTSGQGKGEVPTAERALVQMSEHSDFQTLSPEQKKAIDAWVKKIQEVSMHKPQRTLQSLLVIKRNEYNEVTREVAAVITQLGAFILRKYLAKFNVTFEFARLHDFMETVFVGIVQNLEQLVKEQKRLAA